jgi:hypothetical protein
MEASASCDGSSALFTTARSDASPTTPSVATTADGGLEAPTPCSGSDASLATTSAAGALRTTSSGASMANGDLETFAPRNGGDLSLTTKSAATDATRTTATCAEKPRNPSGTPGPKQPATAERERTPELEHSHGSAAAGTSRATASATSAGSGRRHRRSRRGSSPLRSAVIQGKLGCVWPWIRGGNGDATDRWRGGGGRTMFELAEVVVGPGSGLLSCRTLYIG